MERNSVRLGYEIGSGKEISIPIRHTAVTGQTQESGKTTTLEADSCAWSVLELISRFQA